MSKTANHSESYLQELGFLKARQFLLFVAAIGSMYANHTLGGNIANTINPDSPYLSMILSTLLVFVFAMAIDWGLGLALSALSNVIKTESGVEANENKPLWWYAIIAAGATLALSLCSNYFISQDISGESHLVKFTHDKQSALLRADTLKSKALEQLASAPDTEAKMKADARKKAKAIIAAAVEKGSPSWQKTYRMHKDNYDKWFWTCTDCPSEFKAYRNKVKEAHNEAEQIVANAGGYQQMLAETVTSTLSYNVEEDSTYIKMRQDVISVEQERKSRQYAIMAIFTTASIFCIVLAIMMTFIIRNHRLKFGQQITEDYVSPIMTIGNTTGLFIDGMWDYIHLALTFHHGIRNAKWYKKWAGNSGK